VTCDHISRSQHFSKSSIVKRRVLKTKLLLHNRKLYLTYGMLLCLVTLTDLQTRRAGLSASAELLVDFIKKTCFVLIAFNTNANTFFSYHKCSKCLTLDFTYCLNPCFSKTRNSFVLRRYVNARVSFYCGSFDCIHCNQVTLTKATA